MALKEVGVKLVVEGTGAFQGAMGKVDKSMAGLRGGIMKHNKAIGGAMTALGAGIIATGVSSVKTFAAMGDEVQKMALKTGFSTEKLSELRHAAELSGASLSSIEKATKKMAKTIFDASKEVSTFNDGFSSAADELQMAKEALMDAEMGTAGYEKALVKVDKAQIKYNNLLEKSRKGIGTYDFALKQLGLSTKQLIGLNPEEQFSVISSALADVEDQTMKVALAQDIFGRAGTELLPLLAQGSEGLKEMAAEAHELGIVFDQEAANKAAKFNDDMLRLGKSMDGVKFAIADALIPVLLPLVQKITTVTKSIVSWIKEHPGLFKVLAILTGALGVVAGVLGPILFMLPAITAALPILGIAFSVLLGPVGLVIAAIAGLIAVGILVQKNWTTIANAMKKIWEGIKNVAVAAFKFVARAALSPLETTLGILLRVLSALARLKVTRAIVNPLIGGVTSALNAIQGLSFMAEGGISRGGPTVVGERGPELISLPPGAMVTPNTNTTNFNVEANYTNPQEPQGVRMDLESLLMMTRS